MPYADRFECGYRVRGAHAVLVEAFSAPSYRPVVSGLGERIADLNLQGDPMSVAASLDGSEMVCNGFMLPGVRKALVGYAQSGARALARLHAEIAEMSFEHWAKAAHDDPQVMGQILAESPGPDRIRLRILRVQLVTAASTGEGVETAEGDALFKGIGSLMQTRGVGAIVCSASGSSSLPYGVPPQVHFADYINQLIREGVWEALTKLMSSKSGR